MRLAAVDIGSNTIHVLVADVIRNKLEDVAHYVEMPELGARVARTGSIGTKSRVAIRALRSVIARARKNGFDRLIAGATAAGARGARPAAEGSIARAGARSGRGRGAPCRHGGHRLQSPVRTFPTQPAQRPDHRRPPSLRTPARRSPGGRGGAPRRVAAEPPQSAPSRGGGLAAVTGLVRAGGAPDQPRSAPPRDASCLFAARRRFVGLGRLALWPVGRMGSW